MRLPSVRAAAYITRMKKLNVWSAALVLLVVTGTVFADKGDGPKIPADFQHGYLANSMLVTKDPGKTGLKTGVHLIYVNSVGFDRLKSGGSKPYPDGTVFTDDVREYSEDDGAYQQGGHKFITVMVRDEKKYASTGGWGFQAWLGGDPTKPIVTDSVKQCFGCHVPKKSNDYVFSTFLQ
jgi:Cytochrome P460